MTALKRILALFSLLLAAFLILPALPIPASAQTSNWTIDGNKVYVDDANVYLSATPHTLGSSGWVEFELRSKNYSGLIDAVWGFDDAAGVKPSKPQVWAENVPHTLYRWVSIERTDNITVTGITGFTKLSWAAFVGQPDIGNRNNAYIYKVTAGFGLMGETQTLTVAFNSYTLNGSTASITYNYDNQEKEAYIEYYPDWKPLSAGISTLNLDYAGFNDWKFLGLDTPIQAGVTYKVRAWVEIPFSGLGRTSGKYIWAVKPSGETIAEAKSRGHLYLLDPWYDSQWAYRTKLTFDNSASTENLTNFPVLVNLNATRVDFSKISSNGTDIRFVDADDATLLKYEIEHWTDVSENATIWVKVPQIDAGSTTDYIWLYYGNAAAFDGQDPTNVWETSAKLVTHMKDDPTVSAVADSTANNNDGTKLAANEPIQADGRIYKGQTFDVIDDLINMGSGTSVDNLTAMTVGAWIKPISLGEGGNFGRIFSKEAGWLFYLSTGNKFVLQIPYVTTHVYRISATDLITLGSWNYVVGTWNGGLTASTSIKLYVNGIESSSYTNNNGSGARVDDSANSLIVGNVAAGSATFDGLIDEARLYSEVKSTSWIKADYLSQTDAFITYGTAEFYIGAPTNFTLTDLGAVTISANWTKGLYSTYTMIRAKRNEYPTTVADGELVYYYTESSENVTGYALETTKYYFRAWGFYDDNVTYSSDYAEAYIGGEDMTEVATSVENLAAVLAGLNALFDSTYTLLIVALVFGLIFWQKTEILYALGVPVGIVYGLGVASSNAVNSTLWVVGIAIAILGTYCLYKLVKIGLAVARKKV